MKNTTLSKVCGSPGTKVRFAFFFRLFSPLLIIMLLAGIVIGRLIGFQWVSGLVSCLTLLLLVLLAWLFYDNAVRRFESFLKRTRGAEIVARELAMLPAGWCIFHGIPINGGHGSMDAAADFGHIVVGPPGIIIIETRNWSCRVTIDEGQIRCGGRIPSRSPVVQIRRAAERLGKMLASDAPDSTRIRMVVCIATDNLDHDVMHVDEVTVCNVRVLREILLSTPRSPMSEEHHALLVQKLSSMVM